MKLKYLLCVSFALGIIFFNLITPLANAEQVTIYSEDFMPPLNGWTFSSSTNQWGDVTVSVGDHTGDGFGLGNIGGANYIDNANEQSEATTPTVNLQGLGLSNVKLSFYHWYSFANSLNDGGGIYLWNGTANINPLNLFPAAISGDLNIHVVSGLAYSGHPNEKGWAYNSSGTWRLVVIDLSQIGLQNTNFNMTFVFGEQNTDITHGQGWFIDDIKVTGEKTEFPWIPVIGGIIGIIIAGIITYYFWRKFKVSQKIEESKPSTTIKETPTTVPTLPTTPPPVVVTAPTVKWYRVMGDYETENPLYNNGYSYEIVFEVPCTITPGPDQVIVAHVVITVTVQCKNGTYTINYDYWEAFTLHDPKNDKTTTPDKHYIDKSDLEADIMRRTGCDQILNYTVTRTHTVNLGTVAGASWNNQMDGGAFAYLRNGPPPDNSPSNPSSRPDAPVQGNVTSFSTTGATTFTGTYTYDGQTGSSTYTSSLNPGVTYTFP